MNTLSQLQSKGKEIHEHVQTVKPEDGYYYGMLEGIKFAIKLLEADQKQPKDITPKVSDGKHVFIESAGLINGEWQVALSNGKLLGGVRAISLDKEVDKLGCINLQVINAAK